MNLACQDKLGYLAHRDLKAIEAKTAPTAPTDAPETKEMLARTEVLVTRGQEGGKAIPAPTVPTGREVATEGLEPRVIQVLLAVRAALDCPGFRAYPESPVCRLISLVLQEHKVRGANRDTWAAKAKGDRKASLDFLADPATMHRKARKACPGCEGKTAGQGWTEKRVPKALLGSRYLVRRVSQEERVSPAGVAFSDHAVSKANPEICRRLATTLRARVVLMV